MLRSNSKSLGNRVVSPEEEKERMQWEGFAEKKVQRCGLSLQIYIYTLCLRKKQDTKLLPITSPNVNRFSQFFHLQTHW